MIDAPLRRILLVSPGHRWSTYDVYIGLARGFEAVGVEVVPYSIEDRLPRVRDWIAWSEGEEASNDDERVIYLSSEESLSKALGYNVDAVVVVSGLLYDPRFYVMLGRARVPVFLFGTESPYNDAFYHRCVPMLAAASTNEAQSVASWREAVQQRGSDTRVMHLPLGYDPATHHPGAGDELDVSPHDVVFVGNMYPTRATMLEAVDWAGVDLGLYGVFEMVADNPDWPLWPHVWGATPADPSAVIDNRMTATLYARSKIVLNLFRRETIGKGWYDVQYLSEREAGESINPRMIEAAAMGAFMISEWRPEVERVFGELVPTFRTAAELEALVRHFLAHDEERAALAAQLPGAVAGYSYQERARTIAETLADVRHAMRGQAA